MALAARGGGAWAEGGGGRGSAVLKQTTLPGNALVQLAEASPSHL